MDGRTTGGSPAGRRPGARDRGFWPEIALSALAAVGLCAAVFSSLAAAGSSARRQFSFTLEVRSHELPGMPAKPIVGFRYVVNVDNTGDASDADPSMHPGIHPMESSSPVVEVGDVRGTSTTLTLAEGRYLITVQAPTHKLWGTHVLLPADASATKRVALIPLPLAPGKLVARVFEDARPTNGVADVRETGVAGFRIALRDAGGGAVAKDALGNPICTRYDNRGRPGRGTGGECVTGRDGTAEIPNLPPGRYDVSATPPAGARWIQTTTAEGGAALEARVLEGGLRARTASFGFVRRLDFADAAKHTGRITGCVRHWVRFGPFDAPVVHRAEPVQGAWVALSTAGSDQLSYAAPLQNSADCPDGKIDVAGIPPGAYSVLLWDEQLSFVPRRLHAVVPSATSGRGATVELRGDDGRGNVGLVRFFGWLSGHVYDDVNANGVRDLLPPAEPGIAGAAVQIRARDGSLEQATVTDAGGRYEFPHAVSRLSKFAVARVEAERFATSAPSLHSEYTQSDPGDRGTALLSKLGGGTAAAQLTTAGHRSRVDWGLRAGRGGQISGVVYYATTRRESDPRLATAEAYEPGVPQIEVALWTLGADGRPNTPDDLLLDRRTTDHWQQPTDCDVLDSTGSPVFPEPALPVGPDCVEFPILGNETKDGTFDGSYAFTRVCPPPSGWPCAEGARVPPAAGAYVVAVAVPRDYEIVKEEDVNVGKGVTAPERQPRCVGDPHQVPAGSGSFAGQTRPLCDKRQVTLGAGENATADFFVFTEVPVPGRIFGLVTDGTDVDGDPTSPRHREPRALSNVPVGIRDHLYRLLTTVRTDEHGFFEALVPSADAAACRAATGICPGMYLVVVNDPGDAARPNRNFDTGHVTTPVAADLLPGRATLLETRLAPTSRVACGEYAGPEFFAVNRVAMPADGSPADRQLTIRGIGFGERSQGGGVALVSPGGARIELPADAYDGWADTEIKVTIPKAIGSNPLEPGPYQLLVTAAPREGAAEAPLTAPTGITLHWLGRGYDPPRRYVDGRSGADANPGSEARPFRTIQRGIDRSAAGTLIVVKPATYRENVILHRPVKLQGLGPGGTNGSRLTREPPADAPRRVPGAVIDAAFFNADGSIRASWEATLARVGGAAVPRGAGVTVVAKAGAFGAGLRRAQIDGFAIRSARTDARDDGGGGGIFVPGHGRYLQVSNNLIAGNHGSVGGGIVLGLPEHEAVGNGQITIAHNRILGNGGTDHAGGVGIYGGAEGYTFRNNDVCANFSAAAGGGLAHDGESDGGQIVENRFAFNAATAGGGAVLVRPLAAEAAQAPSAGIDVARNVFSSNQAGDAGAAVQVLSARTSRVGMRNNVMTNNQSGGVGGAVALSDSSNVRIVNNTISANTSTGEAAAVVSTINSPAFQAALPAGAAPFSSALLLNNLLWKNEVFGYDVSDVPGGAAGPRLLPTGLVDFAVAGRPDLHFSPRYSGLGTPYEGADSTNSVFERLEDPFASAFPSELEAGFNADTGEVVVNVRRPIGAGPPPAGDDGLPGDYHLCVPVPGSCPGRAVDSGAGGTRVPAGTIVPALEAVLAPSIDLDGDERPVDGNGDRALAPDLGADELIAGRRAR